MANVFVSYKREDATKVRSLVVALRHQGLDVWWDEDIPVAAQWEATIEQELARAQVVLVCWSPSSVASENVRSEARRARTGNRLIQVFLGPCEPPLFFGERQGVDLSSWRGKSDDARIAKIVDGVRAIAAGESAVFPVESAGTQVFRYKIHAAVSALLILLGALGGWWLLSPARAQVPTTLAVLPFRALSQTDEALVDAIWDDTRGAIGRNPNLRVLGRQAVEGLSKQGLEPADYRKKLGVDYLLDGSVEHVGNQVRMKLSLTRTKDSAEVWNDEIGGKLDDVFAFQQRIAREVEGRIRGRVAPGGGVMAKNIATSGEVYSLYAEARALILKRGNGRGGMGRARELLRQALAIDPNYAPAWTELGVTTAIGSNPQETQEAAGYIRHALQLAPNLAHAHAALAMVQGSPPELESEARRAVILDPNDAEAWMWLGNLYNAQNRSRDALRAYSRAVDIEPLLLPGIGNKLSVLADLGDRAGIEAELKRVAAAGDPVLLAKVKSGALAGGGNIGDAVRVLLDVRKRYGDQSQWVDHHIAGPLLQLGFIDEGISAIGGDPAAASAYRGDAGHPGTLLLGYPRPLDFWQDTDAPALLGRLLIRAGRAKEYAAAFHKAFSRPEDYETALKDRLLLFVRAAPTVAVVLDAGGDHEAAETILRREEAIVTGWLANGPATPQLLVILAQIRGAQGSDDQAFASLARAAAGGWLPDRMFYAADIVDEPCFARLVGRPAFQAVRQKLLNRINEERKKVPVAEVAQAYARTRSKLAA